MDRTTIYLTGIFIIILTLILVILRKRSNHTNHETSSKKKKEKTKKKSKNKDCDSSDSSKEVMVTDKMRELDTTVHADTWNLKNAIDAFKVQQKTYIDSIQTKTL